MDNKETNRLLEQIARGSRIRTVLMAVAALCCVAALVLIMTLLPRVNGILTQMEHTLTNLEQVSEELNRLDLEGMVTNVDALVSSGQESLKQTMEKLDTIDLETLNQAVSDLARIIEPLARLFGR